MSRPRLRALILSAMVLVGVISIWTVYRATNRNPGARAFPSLTPVPGATGFEPQHRPVRPVLRNTAPGSLRVGFAYIVGGIAYDYVLALSFAPGAEQGRAVITVAGEGHDASTDSAAVRRWDVPRNAFAVALSDKFMTMPPVPSLCLKAVVGPDLARYDLADATLCVAQRDTAGVCHPETLACGAVR